MASIKKMLAILFAMVYFFVLIESVSVKKKSSVIITKEDLFEPEKSYERPKRLVETYLTHRQYVYFTKEALKKAKSFVLRYRSRMGTNQRFIDLARQHGLIHLLSESLNHQENF